MSRFRSKSKSNLVESNNVNAKISKKKGTGGGKNKGPKLFGSSIDDSREGIPRVLRFATAYFEIYGVESEGLFRLSPESPLDDLVNKLDTGAPVDISQYSGNTMAGLLKRYFREMPDPFIPGDLYEGILTAVRDGSTEQMVLRLKKILSLLSQPRYATLLSLVELLKSVADMQEKNRMSAENLAIVMAPNLFRPPGDDIQKSLADNQICTKALEVMILNFASIFSVPPKVALEKRVSVKKSASQELLFVLGTGGTFEAVVGHKLVKDPSLASGLSFADDAKKGGSSASTSGSSISARAVPIEVAQRMMAQGNRKARGSVTIDNASLAMLPTLAPPELPALPTASFALGRTVWAMYREDGLWYAATVEGFTNGLYRVSFCDYGNEQICSPEEIEDAPEMNGPAGSVVNVVPGPRASGLALSENTVQRLNHLGNPSPSFAPGAASIDLPPGFLDEDAEVDALLPPPLPPLQESDYSIVDLPNSAPVSVIEDQSNALETSTSALAFLDRLALGSRSPPPNPRAISPRPAVSPRPISPRRPSTPPPETLPNLHVNTPLPEPPSGDSSFLAPDDDEETIGMTAVAEDIIADLMHSGSSITSSPHIRADSHDNDDDDYTEPEMRLPPPTPEQPQRKPHAATLTPAQRSPPLVAPVRRTFTHAEEPRSLSASAEGSLNLPPRAVARTLHVPARPPQQRGAADRVGGNKGGIVVYLCSACTADAPDDAGPCLRCGGVIAGVQLTAEDLKERAIAAVRGSGSNPVPPPRTSSNPLSRTSPRTSSLPSIPDSGSPTVMNRSTGHVAVLPRPSERRTPPAAGSRSGSQTGTPSPTPSPILSRASSALSLTPASPAIPQRRPSDGREESRASPAIPLSHASPAISQRRPSDGREDPALPPNRPTHPARPPMNPSPPPRHQSFSK